MYEVGWARKVNKNLTVFDVIDTTTGRILTSYGSLWRAQGLVSYMNTRKFYEF